MIFSLVGFYFLAMGYIYFTQDEQVFNQRAITKQAKVSAQNVENIALHVKRNSYEFFGNF